VGASQKRELGVIVSVTITNSRESEIADAIRSVVDHVDRVLLIDTGITDRTAEIAEEIAGDKLAVVKHGWIDFSIARNAALDVAKSLGADWILIVDSDERLNFGDLNLRNVLSKMRVDAVRIEASDSHFPYPKDKIVRATSDARFIGPTHEVLRGGSRMTLRGVTFSELPKSRNQFEYKFKRDIKLLTAHTAEHPQDPRWWFYLGISYEGIGARELAAEAFASCVELRVSGDEAAWAAYKQAEQLYALEMFDAAIQAAAKGMAANSTFAECAWIAAVAAYRLGRNDQATAWARCAEAVGRFKGCGLDRTWFKYLPALYELPYDVLKYSLPDGPKRAEAEADFLAAKLARIGATDKLDLDRLSVTRSAPNRYEARAMLRPPLLTELCHSAQNSQISFDPPNGWHPMNPSICWHDGELWCVVRTVNYSMSGRKYTIHDADGIVRTENYLGLLTPDAKLVDAQPMRDLDPAPRKESRIVGYEDVRLVSIDGDGGSVLTAGATVCDRAHNRRLMGWLHLNDDGDVVQVDVQPSQQMHEKNWMPLSVGGKFTWIYSLDPTAVLPGPLRSCPLALEHLRGGAAINFKDGYLCVTHEVIETNEGRLYLHRFVRLDERFNVTAVSPAWVFDHHGIEFCAGMVQDDTHLVLSYGIEDREAWITQVDVAEVEAMEWIKP
jgi:glycosyltransferase involved in cell wall biosynthesis